MTETEPKKVYKHSVFFRFPGEGMNYCKPFVCHTAEAAGKLAGALIESGAVDAVEVKVEEVWKHD